MKDDPPTPVVPSTTGVVFGAFEDLPVDPNTHEGVPSPTNRTSPSSPGPGDYRFTSTRRLRSPKIRPRPKETEGRDVLLPPGTPRLRVFPTVSMTPHGPRVGPEVGGSSVDLDSFSSQGTRPNRVGGKYDPSVKPGYSEIESLPSPLTDSGGSVHRRPGPVPDPRVGGPETRKDLSGDLRCPVPRKERTPTGPKCRRE